MDNHMEIISHVDICKEGISNKQNGESERDGATFGLPICFVMDKSHGTHRHGSHHIRIAEYSHEWDKGYHGASEGFGGRDLGQSEQETRAGDSHSGRCKNKEPIPAIGKPCRGQHTTDCKQQYQPLWFGAILSDTVHQQWCGCSNKCSPGTSRTRSK